MTKEDFAVWLNQQLIKVEFLMGLTGHTPGTQAALMILWSEYDARTAEIEQSAVDPLTQRLQYRDAVLSMMEQLQALVMPGEIDF